MSTLGYVAAGSEGTAHAAASALQQGGTAADAVVAGVLAATVAEPVLASLGGGGFLMTRTADGTEALVDCFVAMPGRGGRAHDAAGMESVEIDFGGTSQRFHVGAESVAVPGLWQGLRHINERFGRLSIHELVRPARTLAEQGVVVDAAFARVLALVWPILCRTPEGSEMFGRDGAPLGLGDRFVSPALAATLHAIEQDQWPGLLAAHLGGAVTDADLSTYAVIEREPLRVRVRDAMVLTNPAPSFGGPLVAHALGVTDTLIGSDRSAIALARAVVDALQAMSQHRSTLGPGVSKGTTHLSVTDAMGNAAAMTVSNGSGSGVFVGDSGIQLNNMLGEEDLHPGGLGLTAPGERIGSMMSPMIIELADGSTVAAGSGGSERIRSALFQFVFDLVERGHGVANAVSSPRMHWDGQALQVEHGVPHEILDDLRTRVPLNEWDGLDFYFGGVHAAQTSGAVAGDPRRGGVSLRVEAN